MEKVREVAAKNGLTVEIIEFSDNVRPNLALADKEVDLNSFQHIPYLKSFSQERGLNLTSIGTTYLMKDADSPYVIVARTADKGNPLYKEFVQAYQSREVAEFILSRFKGSILPAFEYECNSNKAALWVSGAK